MTAADPHESSYACFYDEKLQTYLGDVFSVEWMQDAETVRFLFLIDRSEQVRLFSSFEWPLILVCNFLKRQEDVLR